MENKITELVYMGYDKFEIAKELNIPINNLEYLMKKYKLTKRTSAKEDLLEKIDFIKQELEHKSCSSVARELGYAPSTFIIFLREQGLESYISTQFKKKISKEEFMKYYEENKTYTEMSILLGVCTSTIKRLYDSFGLTKQKVVVDYSLIKDYIEKGFTISEIRMKLKCSQHAVLKTMNKYNIEVSKIRRKETVLSFLKSDKDIEFIARYFGCSESKIRRLL